jgi:hypothetical protein
MDTLYNHNVEYEQYPAFYYTLKLYYVISIVFLAAIVYMSCKKYNQNVPQNRLRREYTV